MFKITVLKFYIKHESRGRIRIHLAQKRMSSVQAETLLYYLQNQNQVSFAKVYDRTGDAVICYEGERAALPLRGSRAADRTA